MQNQEEFFSTISDEFNKAVTADHGEQFMRFSAVLGEVDRELREYVQNMTAANIKKIIGKLNNGSSLNSDELSLVESWIVGDAERYTNLENNYNDWLAELKRLLQEIDRYRSPELDFEAAMSLRGLIYDATRVLSDIIYFLQQRDRIACFKESVVELDAEKRSFLIRILEEDLSSKDF